MHSDIRNTLLQAKQLAILKELKSGDSLSEFARADLIAAFTALVAGHPAELFQTIIPTDTTDENHLIKVAREAAARYVCWARAGKIQDDQPIDSVARQYDVNEETIALWLASFPEGLSDAQTDYLPEDIMRQMKIGGRQYRKRK